MSATPTFTGGPSASPVMDMSPVTPWMIESYPAHSRLGPEAEVLHGPRLEVFDHHVGLADQRLEDLLAAGMLQVERDRLLVAVDREEVGRRPVGGHGRRPLAGVVPPG